MCTLVCLHAYACAEHFGAHAECMNCIKITVQVPLLSFVCVSVTRVGLLVCASASCVCVGWRGWRRVDQWYVRSITCVERECTVQKGRRPLAKALQDRRQGGQHMGNRCSR